MERICGLNDVNEGSMKEFKVNEKQILLANINGEYFAVDAICTHQGGNLSNGQLRENIVVCPSHGTQFDVTSGKVIKNVSRLTKYLTGEATDLKSYPVSVDSESVFIEL